MTITKRNGKYYCRFQINGERHHYLCSGASSVKEAEKIENAFKYKLQQQQNGVIPKENKKVKLSLLIKLYDEYGKINKLSYGRDYFGKYICEYFNVNTTVDNIKAENIENFKIYLKTTRNSSNSTINKYLSALSKMFNLGISNKLIKENPVKEVRKLREDNYKIRFLTVAEEQKLFRVIKRNFPYLEPIVICALQTGMRRGEILNLKWEQVDFDYGYIELLQTKSGKSRKIPLSKTLRNALEQIDRKTEYVFVNPLTKKPYTDIHNNFKTILEKAKIDNFRFHDLRHTVATRLVEKGIDLVVVKEILGHSKIDTTLRYAHAVPKRKLEAIEVLNSYN